jgi:hypothetical protein
VGKPEGKNHLEDQGVDGRMGSEWIFGKLAGVCSSFNWRNVAYFSKMYYHAIIEDPKIHYM